MAAEVQPHKEDHQLAGEIYEAVSHGRNEKVIEFCFCNKNIEGPFYKLGLHKSSVLQLACFLKNFKLAIQLLDNVFYNTPSADELYNLLKPKNSWGNTILHDAVTSNQGIEFVKKLLHKVPRLLKVRNNWGENPLLTAIRYGRKGMYVCLINEADRIFGLVPGNLGGRLKHLKRGDNMTILHMAILTRQFWVALDIVNRYPDQLYKVEDDRKLTALQMLAKSPTAFKSGTKLGPLQTLVYTIVSTDDQDEDKAALVGMTRKVINSILKSCWCLFPMIKEVRKIKKNNKYALELAKKLIIHDLSWKETSSPLVDSIGADEPSASDDDDEPLENERGVSEVNDDTPLHLAAKKGCIEIVKKILKVYPQAVDYLNSNQENLFHVAIKSRNQEIIKIVRDKKLLRRGQLIAIDKDYNTIMHKVGWKPFGIGNEDTKTKTPGPKSEVTTEEVHMDTEIKTPIRELSDELSLLETLEGLCPKYLLTHQNVDNLTARELFAKTNAGLREKAKEYLKQTAEHCTVVTILIATVAFAAAYTVPGGPDERTGLPVLLGQPLFIVFTITDVLSLGFGLTAVVIFLTILTSQFRMKDFQRTLPRRLLLGLTLLFLSVTMMMVSFAATIILTINTKQDWTKIALYIVAFFPVIIFMMSYIPFYKELLEILSHCISSIGSKLIPRRVCGAPKTKDDFIRKMNV